MFYIFLLYVVLFFVMFFSLAARYIRQFESAEDNNWAWPNLTH